MASLMLVLAACAACGGTTSEDLVNFRSLAGSGRVDYIESGKVLARLTGYVAYVDSVDVPGESDCEAVEFSTEEEKLIALVRCGSGQSFSCVREIARCRTSGFVPSSGPRNEFGYSSELSGDYYVVELRSRGLVYKIQALGCLIEYPHGCLIPSPFLQNRDHFEFSLGLRGEAGE